MPQTTLLDNMAFKSSFTGEEIRRLLENGASPCVSLFLPTQRAGPEARDASLHLKNLLDEADTQLENRDMRSPERRGRLDPARALIDDAEFWNHQDLGLALYLDAEGMRGYRLPIELAERAVVAERRYVKPLTPLLDRPRRFALLALSASRARLFRGDDRGLTPIADDRIPSSFVEAVGVLEEENALQHHSGSPPKGKQEGSAVFHGHGAGGDDDRDKQQLDDYCHAVARGVDAALTDTGLPLLLYGVKELAAMYRRASSYPHLLDESVEGNPDHADEITLHRQAWPVVSDVFEKHRAERIERINRMAQSDKAEFRLDRLLVAAHDGLVEHLVIAPDRDCPGRYDPDRRKAEWHDPPRRGDEDLIDLAVVKTLSTGGRVWACATDEAPHASPAWAVLRGEPA